MAAAAGMRAGARRAGARAGARAMAGRGRAAAAAAAASGDVYGFSAALLGAGSRAAPEAGATVSMADLCKGKVALIENVATI